MNDLANTTSPSTALSNALVVGCPGSGRGVLIKANLHVRQHSAVVVDLKGDPYARKVNVTQEGN